MDIILSLSHFCENDGPTSILCTQIKPVECLSCYPASISSSVGDLEAAHRDPAPSAPAFLPSSNRSSFDFGGIPESVPNSASTSPELPPASLGPHRQTALRPLNPLNRFPVAGSNGRGCESCTISLPEEIASKLPPGAPGSPKADGSGRNGSPILRFKESLQIYRDQQNNSDSEEDREGPIRLNHQQSSPESFASDTSASFYHEHTLSYISTSTPTDPNTYSIIRRAAIRTLSGEQLPRGQTAGELFFGTPLDGWTIAYKFRLSDPYARGGYRKYALIALASSETRAYQVMTFIWEHFRCIAGNIIMRTAQKAKENEGDGDNHEDVRKEHRIPVSSFLTGRTTDPDGYPRQYGAARMRARSLTEMVGDDKFFAELHLEFVGMLRELMGGYGG